MEAVRSNSIERAQYTYKFVYHRAFPPGVNHNCDPGVLQPRLNEPESKGVIH